VAWRVVEDEQEDAAQDEHAVLTSFVYYWGVLCRRHFRTGAALPARATRLTMALNSLRSKPWLSRRPMPSRRWAWAVPEKRGRHETQDFQLKLQRESITIVYNLRLRQMLIITHAFMSCGMTLGCSAVVPSHFHT
jgi:hypothetical protein